MLLITTLAAAFVIVLASMLWASPSPTARGTPAGIPLPDGFRSKLTISGHTTISLWERDTQPPGGDGGTPIDMTTHHNVRRRTFAPRSLITNTDTTHECLYDPIVFDDLDSLVNVEATYTQAFWDGTTRAYFGILQKYDTGRLKEGEPPTVTLTVTPTNRDPSSHAEQGPVTTNVPGT